MYIHPGFGDVEADVVVAALGFTVYSEESKVDETQEKYYLVWQPNEQTWLFPLGKQNQQNVCLCLFNLQGRQLRYIAFHMHASSPTPTLSAVTVSFKDKVSSVIKPKCRPWLKVKNYKAYVSFHFHT